MNLLQVKYSIETFINGIELNVKISQIEIEKERNFFCSNEKSLMVLKVIVFMFICVFECVCPFA